MAASQSPMPITSEITIPVANIEHVYEDIGSDVAQASTPCSSLYENTGKEQLRIQIQHQDIGEGGASKTPSEFATYHNPYAEETVHSPGAISKLSYSGSVKSKHVHTRQLNVFIGEEIEENIHSSVLSPKRKVYSCPPTPKALKRVAPISIEPIESASTSTGSPRGEPMHYFFHDLPEEEPPAYNEFLVKLNPHNKINHMIHGALHCPCFFFFFLFCCMPAVFWMQLGDKAYKNGDVDEARLLGRKATVSYFIGAVLGISVLSTVILISVYFVQDQLGQ